MAPTCYFSKQIQTRKICWSVCLFGSFTKPLGGWGLLLSNRLLETCCWMESHFHDWIYYSEVVFSIKLLKWSFFLGKKYWKVGIKNGKTHS